MSENDEIPPPIPPIPEPAPPPAQRATWPTWVEILMCSGYPTQFVLGQLLVVMGISPFLPDGKLSSTFVFAISLADTVLLLLLIVVFLIRRGERPATVFFGERRGLREIAVGVISLPFIIALVTTLTMIIRGAAPSLRNVPINPLEGLITSGASVWLFLVVVIVAGGVREELQRAFLLHRFRGDLGQPWLGLFITSLAFGMGHTLQGLDAAIITGSLGAAWGALYLLRGSALAGITSHSVFNSVEVLQALLR